MIRLHTDNLTRITPTHGLTAADLTSDADKIASYLERIHARGQGFYRVIDTPPLEAIRRFVNDRDGEYTSVVVLGIGGSALGTICLQQSLSHLFENELPERTRPKLYVLDNIDPRLMREVEDVIDFDKTLFIVVTKSGGTPETLAQYFYFRKELENRGLDVARHFAFITDPEKGLLRRIGRAENIPMFDVPPDVGGRFSVQTAVGLLPAALAGMDVDALLAGMRAMRDRFLSTDFNENLPFRLASIQYQLGRKGKVMHVLMPYAQSLIRFADWYRQLLAESIGKRKNNAGEDVYVGLTPINALGATDQHSQSQLYNEGPNDKLIMFLETADFGGDVEIPVGIDDEAVAFLKGVSFGQLLNTEKRGTEQALTESDRPNLTIGIERVDAYTLGELFMLFEGATAFLGEFYDIDAFDQPGVERSKVVTKQLLS